MKLLVSIILRIDKENEHIFHFNLIQKGLLFALWGIQLCSPNPTYFHGSDEVNLDQLFGFIGNVVHESIKLHRGHQQQSDIGNYGDEPYVGGQYGGGQENGRPSVGVSKYEIIDLNIKPNIK